MSEYQLFPSLKIEEVEALTADIRERGVLVPVEVDEEGTVLDGHHRVMIAESLGIEYPTVTRSGMSEAEKLEHVFALNIARRHLSPHDRSAVVSLCRERGMTLRAIAKAVGVSHTTARRDLSRAGTNVPAECDQPESEPVAVPEGQTRAERVRELADTGMTQAAIAAEMGISKSTVSTILHPPSEKAGKGADLPADWSHTKALLAEIKSLPDKAPEPRLFARAVPPRNRASVARTLREVGTLLGTIARELERSAD